MKYCPVCRNDYADETLLFCLEDGTPLAGEARQSTIDTIAFSHPLTAEVGLRTEELKFVAPNASNRTQQNLRALSEQRLAGQSETRKSHFALLPMLAAFLLFAASGGIGVWFYLDSQNKSPTRDSAINSSPANAEQTALANQKAIVEKVSLEKTAHEPPANAGREQIKKEIATHVEEWKNLAEARNLAGYARKYAETVDFYEKGNVKLAEVRGEIQKTFTNYDQINITLTNVKVAVNADGSRATAVFDNEWEYENSKDLSEGRAHVELKFQKSGDGWKIVGERFLEIYEMEN